MQGIKGPTDVLEVEGGLIIANRDGDSVVRVHEDGSEPTVRA